MRQIGILRQLGDLPKSYFGYLLTMASVLLYSSFSGPEGLNLIIVLQLSMVQKGKILKYLKMPKRELNLSTSIWLWIISSS
jgi:hypothetical protein